MCVVLPRLYSHADTCCIDASSSSPHSVLTTTIYVQQLQRCSCTRVRGCARGLSCQSQADGLHGCSVVERYAPLRPCLHSPPQNQRLFDRFVRGNPTVVVYVHDPSILVHTCSYMFIHVHASFYLLRLLLLLTRACPWFMCVVSCRSRPHCMVVVF